MGETELDRLRVTRFPGYPTHVLAILTRHRHLIGDFDVLSDLSEPESDLK
jgi:hypothetical protein